MLGLCSRSAGEGSMSDNSEIDKSKDDREQQQISALVVTTMTSNCQQQKQPQQQNQGQLHLPPSDVQAERKLETVPSNGPDSAFNNQRVFKKSLPNNKLTLYLVSRDLVVSDGKIDTLQGVLLVDPEYVRDKKVYGQVTLTFRYGREDEEVMGLKFCTEAIVYRAQLYPMYPGADHQEATSSLQETFGNDIIKRSLTDSSDTPTDPLNDMPGKPIPVKRKEFEKLRMATQHALLRRLGPNAHAFTMEVPPVVPPSVRLLPAKEYNGAPIGTSYDIKAYVAEKVDEKLHRNSTVRMGIRVVQQTSPPPLPANNLYTVQADISKLQTCNNPQSTRIMDDENEITKCNEPVAPHAAMEKPFLLSGGAVRLEAWLDRAIYAHGDTITVHVNVTNESHKSVKRLQVLVLQHVDVCMFNSGKFKNVVAVESEREACPIGPGSKLTKNYCLRPMMGSTKNWIALEDNYTKAGTSLASTVVCSGNGEKDRDPFAINVSYYVKVKLLISLMGGVVSLKLPFTLMHRNSEPDLIGFPSPVREFQKKAEIVTEDTKEKTLLTPATKDDDSIDRKPLISTEKKIHDQMANADLIEQSEGPEST